MYKDMLSNARTQYEAAVRQSSVQNRDGIHKTSVTDIIHGTNEKTAPFFLLLQQVHNPGFRSGRSLLSSGIFIRSNK